MSRWTHAVWAVLVIPVAAAHLWLAFQGAGFTFGYDYLAYDAAARRLLSGAPLYDLSITSTGTFGLFYYPPTFILGVLPFTLLNPAVATWAWIGMLIAAFLVGAALLPVRSEVRWLVLLLAGISWPFVFGIRLGQVGPLLFLAFAAGWRARDRPGVVGASGAVGALIKVQPGLVLLWAFLARRWRAVAVGFATIAAGVVVSSLVAGPSAWIDFLTILRRVYDPLTSSQNLSPGATAYFLGAGLEVAGAVQLLSTVIVGLIVLVVSARGPAEVGYVTTVVASQLVSPFLWDHYALLLLIPVAWLLQRRHWWALAIPLSQAYVLVPIMPTQAYLVSFYAMLIAPALATLVERARPRAGLSGAAQVGTSQPP